MSEIEGLTPSLDDGEVLEELVPVEEGERHFGRYVLRYEIASGGMATVYLARARGPAGFDRPLAIKRIHPHLAKKREFVDMFLDEARLVARITHPNVCSVFDFGQAEGTYFMAMEYLVGQPLSQVLRALVPRPELATSERYRALAAKLIADACEGLHAAHELRNERGEPLHVVHRDCTPHNLFVTYDGAVKVVDFGVAYSEGRLQQTQSGTLKGKLGYMSPEQVRGAPVDRRLDVWALGACLWELLTQRRLFPKKTEVELIQSVAHDPIAAPSTVRPGIAPQLDAIVLRALDRDLSRRYPTTRAMARDLNAFISTTGQSASMADVSELMEELFHRERETKLGVVRSVLDTNTDTVPEESEVSTGVVARPPPSADELTELAPAGLRLEPDETPVLGLAPRPAAPQLAAPQPAPPQPAPTQPVEARAAPSAITSRGLVLGAGAVLVLLASAAAFFLARPAEPGPLVIPGVARELAVREPSGSVSHAAPDPVLAPSEPTVTSAPEEPSPPGGRTSPDEPSEAEEREGPAPERPRVVTTGTGTVNIAARGGWADIFVDGERVGRTPRSLSLRAGRHVIELRPPGGGAPIRRTVTVRTGRTTALVEEL